MNIETTLKWLSDAIVSDDRDEVASLAYVVEDWLTLQGRRQEAIAWHNLAVAHDS